jgi:hypothetical protein
MAPREDTKQFESEVFPAELEEIAKRRERLDLPAVPPGRAPSAELGLVGLALSGGGIRSATFSLGVIQALAKHGLLKTVDYLSTVSGGGFIGSCVSTVLNSPDQGPEQARFPLRYEVGAAEPMAVGHLRNGSKYLAPGGLLDKLRIPALVLRGVISNLFIFLFIIFLMVLATEVVYEVGQRLRVPFSDLVLGGLIGFLGLVVVFPIIARWLRGGSTYQQRNFWEMAFALALVVLLVAVFLIPVFIVVDQAIDSSWSEVKEGVTANLLRPFEARDSLQWVIVFGVLILFMMAGRASQSVSRLGGKLVLLALGLIGPLLLGTVYLALVVMEIDSAYVTPNEIFSLDAAFAQELDEATISPELRQQFKDNHVRLAVNAEVITLQEDVRWLLRDSVRAFSLVREEDDLSVYPDFQDALGRGKIPPGLVTALASKGYVLDPITLSRPKLRDNRFELTGVHRYWIDRDPHWAKQLAAGGWSLEQIVSPHVVVEVLQRASYDLQISDAPAGTLIREGLSLSDDDRELAIRFVEEGNPHDVVLVLDNSGDVFENPERFRVAFAEAFEKALADLGATARMAVFWFDSAVYTGMPLTPLTKENKQELLERVLGSGQDSSPLNFEARFSNSPAALVRARRELTEKGRPLAKKSIVFVSDGNIVIDEFGHNRELENWLEEEFALDAAGDRIRIFGIALSSGARFDLFQTLARQTGGAFYPLFESTGGVTFKDLFGAMEKLKESAGSRLSTRLDRVTITDQDDDTPYVLSRSAKGVRIRVALPAGALSPDDLAGITDPIREIFEVQGVELSDQATIKTLADNRWEVDDPYRYVISRSGLKLQVIPEQQDQTDDGSVPIGSLIPASLWDDSTDSLFVGVLLFLLVYWLVVDVNVTAAHRFYRDRLSKAYLFGLAGDGTVEHHDAQRLSTLNTPGSAAPYHLVNVALNLQGAHDSGLRGRQSDFFIFSKRFTGSTRTGFLPTEQMEQCDKDLDLGTAMAISGAAAAPNMGATTMKSLVFIMTLLNIRLGYWLPNPRVAGDPSWLARIGLRRRPGPKYLLQESLGHVHDADTYLNVSDGGHIENLGVYELLRRRCRFIIVADGEADPEMKFNSLVKLLLYARIDMGIEIDMDLEPIRKDSNGLSDRQWALGQIRYAGGEVGHLLYIKSSVTGDEYEYIRAYRVDHPSFPHESTAEQFFTETQFEAYRALGYSIGDKLFSDDQALGEFKRLQATGA